jgi:hypothetical protein
MTRMWERLGLALGRIAIAMGQAWRNVAWFLGPRRRCWLYGHDLTPGGTIYGPEWGPERTGYWPYCKRCKVDYKTRDLTGEEVANCLTYASKRGGE